MPAGPDSPQIHRLQPGDAADFEGMLDLFASAFDDPASYASARPSDGYRRDLLARDDVIALVAKDAGTVIGALVAYELRKFEQERSEIYIYDLAVATSFRRRGVATAMITALKDIARARNAWVIYVQADHGDDAAIALYAKLGTREDVLHFDLAIG